MDPFAIEAALLVFPDFAGRLLYRSAGPDTRPFARPRVAEIRGPSQVSSPAAQARLAVCLKFRRGDQAVRGLSPESRPKLGMKRFRERQFRKKALKTRREHRTLNVSEQGRG